MLFLKSIWLVVLQSTLMYCIISICLQSETFIIFQPDVNAFRLTPWSLANRVCAQTQHKCNWQDLSLKKSLTNYNNLFESFESLSQSPRMCGNLSAQVSSTHSQSNAVIRPLCECGRDYWEQLSDLSVRSPASNRGGKVGAELKQDSRALAFSHRAHTGIDRLYL